MLKADRELLTESQREIMEIVWDQGRATVTEIYVKIKLRREVARNTIQTLTVRLEQKGWLKHIKEGRKFVYMAAKPRTKSLGSRVAHLIDRLFGGSPEQLVNALLDYRGLTDSELQNIRQMLDQAEPQNQIVTEKVPKPSPSQANSRNRSKK